MKKSFLLIAGAAGLAMSLTAVADAQHRGGSRGHDGGGHAMRGLMMLRAADANGDNTVTRAEVDQLQGEMFTWMDRNGDGVLSSADRSPMHQRMMAMREARADNDDDGERRRGRGGRRGGRGHGGDDHARMDANDDGQVTREEFMARGAPGFERLDANSDGSVTPDELDAAIEQGRERREDRVFWWRD